jgi:hypothetical protein
LRHSLRCGHFWSAKQGPAWKLHSPVFTLSENPPAFEKKSLTNYSRRLPLCFSSLRRAMFRRPLSPEY